MESKGYVADYEKFTLIHNDDGTYSFRSARWGNYANTFGGTGHGTWVNAGDNIGDYEKWIITPSGDNDGRICI